MPYIEQKDDFGGMVVSTPAAFIPARQDYTLEVTGTAGTPIIINQDGIEYTPKSTGKVRFAKTGDAVFVFEDKMLTAELSPKYEENTFTYVPGNLIANPSFEETKSVLESGKWVPAYWETWTGGTSAWATGSSTSVRENASYRSDGTKSVIIHSNAHYLMQDLGADAFKAGRWYELSYDYWTSEGAGNGGALYQIYLGSDMLGSNILKFNAHTTDATSTSKMSYSIVFCMPEHYDGSDVWLSLYREESKVDWFDDFCLREIETSTSAGISGATDVVYLVGSAYAPENANLGEQIQDMTPKIQNPDFANGSAGWTITAEGSKISTTAKADGLIVGSQNHLQFWVGSGGVNGKLYQTLTDMPNGKYTLSAVVVPSFSGSVSLFAGEDKSNVLSGTNKAYSVTGVATDGTLEIGMEFATSGSSTIDIDDFTLTYSGADKESFATALKRKMAKTEATIAKLESDTAAVGSEYLEAYKSSLASAQSVLANEESTMQDVLAALTAIQTIDTKYNDAVDAYNQQMAMLTRLEDAILSAEELLVATNYDGKEKFELAIAEAKDALSTADPALVPEAFTVLNNARETYYNSQYPIQPVEQIVSYVDHSLSNGAEKFVLRVDGKPYYGTNIQIRLDKLYGYNGWTDEEMESVMKQAAADGFNTVSIPLFWREVEPEKDVFDWTILDKYLNWCHKYGLKMELLWFSWSSGGRVQYLINYNGVKTSRDPDYVCSLQGTSEFRVLRSSWEPTLDWRDTDLRARDTYVLSRIMEHIALWDANNGNPHTVIGVQLGNEARTHDANTATAAEIIEYYSHVGSAVKNSKYSVWTRLNCVSNETYGRTQANENKRNNGGTNIDFVGIDLYGGSTGDVKGNIWGQLPAYGKNYRMIMECDAGKSSAPFFQMAALAGDKAFDYYNYCVVDGNCLYGNSGHTLVAKGHVPLVRQRNKMLNMDIQDVALKSHGRSLYVYNYAGSSTAPESGIEGIVFTPSAASTQAVAIRRSSNELVLLSTSTGSFTLPATISIGSAETGYFDADNKWVKEGEASFDGQVVQMTGVQCVRIESQKAEHAEIINGDFEEDALGWTITANGQKISTTSKGDGFIEGAPNRHMQFWAGNTVVGKMYQELTGLPNGEYTLKADIWARFSGMVCLYAGTEKTEVENNVARTYEANVTVEDGTLELGLEIDASGSPEINIDNVILESRATGIIEVTSEEKTDDCIYNLSGQRVEGVLPKGIYIKNGEKILIK